MTDPDTAAQVAGADLVLAEQFLEAIGALRRQTRRVAGRPWPAVALSGAQVELVRLVRRQPGISVADAAAQLGVAPNTVSTLVRQLTDAGLLRRTSDTHDRRVARLRLTAAARRRVEHWRDRRTALAATALAGLSTADRAAIENAVPVIGRLASALREGAGAGERPEPVRASDD